MAIIRNDAGEERFIPLAGRIVADGDELEVDDAEFDNYDWSSADFKVVTEPARKPATKSKTSEKES